MERMIVILIGVCFVTSAVAGQERYVVPSKTMNIVVNKYALWTSRQFADSCAKAAMYGTKEDQKTFCETGFSGLKPKVGMLIAETEVELLDSRECDDMAYVRVLTGELKSETGCITATALSSVKP